MQILFYHQSTDGHSELSPKTTILHIDGYGYLRIVHRCEPHEYGMVVTTVLGGSRLATNNNVKGRYGFPG